MALFGSLDSMPLEELLLVLKSKEGALEIWNVKGLPATTLYLKPGRIRSIDQRGKPLPPEAAKAVLLTLLKAREGSFGYASTGPRKKPSFPWSPFTTSLTATGACFPTLRPASASKGAPRKTPGTEAFRKRPPLTWSEGPRRRSSPRPSPYPWTWSAFTS